MAVSGDLAIVGAQLHDEKGTNSGAAYIFRRGTSGAWAQEQKLLAPDGAAGNLFGYAVAINGTTAAAVAPGAYVNGVLTGATYIFRHNGASWVLDQKLPVGASGKGDSVAASVSISGNALVVGNSRDSTKGLRAGAVYVYRYYSTRAAGDRWVQEQALTASDGTSGDWLGYSVAISGNWIAAGTHGDDDLGLNSGSIYLFSYNGSSWTQRQKLVPTDGAAYDQLGYSVALDGTTLVAGAIEDKDRGLNFGSAYVYRFNGSTWVYETQLYGSGSSTNGYFGWSVAVMGDIAVVGAYKEDPYWVDSGSAYVFRRVNGVWGEDAVLEDPNAYAYNYFGQAVAASTDLALVGAYKAAGTGTASAYNSACLSDGCTSNAECNDNNVCTTDVCNLTTGVCTNTNNTLTCNDGNACTTSDRCSNGACAGTPMVCNDNNACTTDSCSNGVCQFLNNTSTCSDGNACTTGDRCSNGACVGTPMVCNDNNPCTTDTCSNGLCQYANNASSCNDGNACTTNDWCSNGVCSGTAIVCNDNNPCTTDSCSNGLCQYLANTNTCNDGNACTTSDRCSLGACVGTPIVCNDGVACTVDSCVNGVCQYNSSGCGCLSNADCNDNNVCTTDVCNTTTRTCSYSNNTLTCNDGNACTTSDRCANGVCAGVPISCNDGNPCTTDSCSNGACAFVNNTNTCNDNDACTGSDRCSSGVCRGVALTCDDGIACTTDYCVNGSCVFDAAACSCLSDLDCDDNDPCTTDRCSTSRVCSHTLQSSCCGNGTCETGEDSCNCSDDCVGAPSGPVCGNGICEAGDGESCLTCPSDCNGVQNGSPSNRFCCGNGSAGYNPVTCSDARCTTGNWDCTGTSVVVACCGDGSCAGAEDSCSCPQDCGAAAARELAGENCTDGLDGDCDGLVDCQDPDCGGEASCWSCNRNGVCQPGEDCKSCPSDCDGQTGGRRQDRFCCGNGVREQAEGSGAICDGNP